MPETSMIPARPRGTVRTAPRARVSDRPRRRFALRTLISIVSATLLCILVTWIRDRNKKAVFLASAVVWAECIQEYWAQTGSLPTNLDGLADAEIHGPLDEYAYEDTRFYALQADTPTIIGYTAMAQLYTSYNGRAVIFFGREGVSVEWINEGRFRRLLRNQDRRVTEAVRAARAAAPRLPE